MLSSQALQMKQSKSPSRPFKNDGDSLTLCSSLPALPDVVLCSALSTSILHGQRVYRERRRHKAAVQTRGRENLEQLELEDMMEPLVRRLQDLLHNTDALHPDPAREEKIPSVSHNNGSRTISTSSSNTATASKLSSTTPVRKRSQTISISTFSTTTARKRSQTISHSSTATKLSALSAAVLSAHKLTTDSLNLQDTPEKVLDTLSIFLKKCLC